MKFSTFAVPVLVALALNGCASVQYGDKEEEARLRKLHAVPGKVSLYVCREAASFNGAGNRTTVIVNGQAIATLKPNNFAHAELAPGALDVKIKRNPGGESGVLTLNPRAGEVPIVWVGITGGGFGALTVDFFSTRRDAESCVRGAEYAVRAAS